MREVVKEAKDSRSTQKLKKRRKDPPLKPSEGARHANTSVSDF